MLCNFLVLRYLDSEYTRGIGVYQRTPSEPAQAQSKTDYAQSTSSSNGSPFELPNLLERSCR